MFEPPVALELVPRSGNSAGDLCPGICRAMSRRHANVLLRSPDKLPHGAANRAGDGLSADYLLRPLHRLRNDVLLADNHIRAQRPIGAVHDIYAGVDDFLLLRALRHGLLRFERLRFELLVLHVAMWNLVRFGIYDHLNRRLQFLRNSGSHRNDADPDAHARFDDDSAVERRNGHNATVAAGEY